MKAEIITIGDEILIGQVVNTNSSWISENLNNIGIKVTQISTIGDDIIQIINALKSTELRADLIIITGGLGPTKDDITKFALCKFFNTKLVFNDSAFQNIKHIFESRNIPVNELNKAQAMLPESCTALNNKFGTAPGLWFEKNGKIFVSLPGVPYEMKFIMEDSVLKILSSKLKNLAIVHKTIMTTGIGESFIAEKLSGFESDLPEYIKLAYLPKPGIVRLRLSGMGNNKKLLKNELDILSDKIQNILGTYVYGFDEEKLEKVVGDLLIRNNATLSIAESCTGGYVSHLITSVAGSSKYYKGSLIAYSNEIKMKFLDVDKKILEKHGAVSCEIVTEMASNIRKKYSSTYSIACTGIAGPGGGSNEKPIGTVWIAVGTPKITETKKLQLSDNRERNIERASIAALNLLRLNLMTE